MHKTNRRRFLKQATAATAGFMIVPRHVLGGTGFIAPSDQLTKAIIGVGGIMSGKDAADKINAGASLVQLYTGLIYRGPELVAECAKQIR